MGSTPKIPPGTTPTVPAYWREEQDWIAVIEFLRSDDEEERASIAESIGYLFAYAQWTNTRMLALIGSRRDEVYELLFSFDCAANKEQFLRLMQSNEVTAREEGMLIVPKQDEIDAAQPISKVLPADVLRQVFAIAGMLAAGVDPNTIP